MYESKEQCPSCLMWQNTGHSESPVAGVIRLSEVSLEEEKRIQTGPWDEAFGGGLINGRVEMIGGAPGAGKSTLALMLADAFSECMQKDSLYIAAEERASQIRGRSKRLRLKNEHLILVLPVGSTPDIGQVILTYKPCFVVLDSVATITNDLDEQVSYASRLKEYADKLNLVVLIVNQISQESDFQGKTKLQHAVDGLFTFFSDDMGVRTLFVEKNRDGQAQIKLAFGMYQETHPETPGKLHPIMCKVCQRNQFRCVCE